MRRRNHCLIPGEMLTREIPEPAPCVVIETLAAWKMVRRGVRKRIVSALGETEAFSEDAAADAAAQDIPPLR